MNHWHWQSSQPHAESKHHATWCECEALLDAARGRRGRGRGRGRGVHQLAGGGGAPRRNHGQGPPRAAQSQGAPPGAQGRAVQVDPIKPKLKAPGTKRFKLKCDTLLSTSAFKFNLRRYTKPKKPPAKKSKKSRDDDDLGSGGGKGGSAAAPHTAEAPPPTEGLASSSASAAPVAPNSAASRHFPKPPASPTADADAVDAGSDLDMGIVSVPGAAAAAAGDSDDDDEVMFTGEIPGAEVVFTGEYNQGRAAAPLIYPYTCLSAPKSVHAYEPSHISGLATRSLNTFTQGNRPCPQGSLRTWPQGTGARTSTSRRTATRTASPSPPTAKAGARTSTSRMTASPSPTGRGGGAATTM